MEVLSFGVYLRRLRESRGFSLRQAAQAAEVSSGYLSQVEGGKRGRRKGGEEYAPHPQILRRLANVYHVSAEDLFERAGFFERKQYQGFSEEREVDRCFDFVVHDPTLKRIFTVLDKRAIVDRYEALTARKLITWAGDWSVESKKPDFKGLRIESGTLYADTVNQTLTLEEVARELGTDVESVRKLSKGNHLGSQTGRKEELQHISKADLREFKSYLVSEGLRILMIRDRRHMPKTDEEYIEASSEATSAEWRSFRRKTQGAKGPKPTSTEPKQPKDS